MKWLLPISLLVVFEFVADIFAKEWSLNRTALLAAGALGSYMLANTFWLFALKNGSGLARGAIIFSVSSGIIALVLGIGVYKETVSRVQVAGLILGLVSIALILWNE